MGEGDISRVRVVSDRPSACSLGGDQRGSRTHERIEDQIVDVGVEVDQLERKLHREWGRVLDPPRALGIDLPNVARRLDELVVGERCYVRETFGSAFLLAAGAVETALRR